MGKLRKLTLDTSQLDQDQEIVVAKFERNDLFESKNLRSISYFSDKKNDVKAFKRKILIVESDKLKYAATNYASDAKSFLSCSRYYVGLLNKNTKKMRLVNTSMYDIRPTIIGNPFDTEKANEDKTDKKKINVRDELTKAFGSTKKQRSLESKLKHHVDAEDVTNLMNAVVKDVEVTEPVQQEEVEDKLENLLPPINRSAQKVEDVYSLKNLVIFSEDLNEEWESVSEPFINATNEDIKKWNQEKQYPGFVLQGLSKLPAHSETRTEKCKLLMYMNLLWRLLQIRAQQLQSREYLQEVSEGIREQLMLKYFQVSARFSKNGPSFKSMTAKQKDCLLAYIIVLTLLLNKFSFAASDLMPDLKVSQIKFNMLVRAIGGKVTKVSTKLGKVDVVSLSLPLTVLEVKQPRNRRL